MFAKALAFRMGTSASATRNARTKALRSSGWPCIWLPGSKLTSAFSRVRRHVFVLWTDAELKDRDFAWASSVHVGKKILICLHREAVGSMGGRESGPQNGDSGLTAWSSSGRRTD